MNKYDKYRIEPRQNASINKWDKYKITPQKQEGDSWSDIAWKAPLKGLTEVTIDAPANIMHLLERGGRKALGFFREQAGKPNNIDQGAENDFFSPENVDRPSKWLNTGAKKLGVDLTPRPITAGQRVFTNAGEFAGSLVPWGAPLKGANMLNKATNATKLIGTGGAIGATSGALQEEGVDPLAADLLSIFALPAGARAISNTGKGIGNLFSNFTKAGQEKKIRDAASDILKDKVGDKNIGRVLDNLNAPTPFNTNLNTAERAQNTGISTLHRALAPNIPAIAEKEALADNILRKELNKLSPKTGLEPSQQGEAIRDYLDRELKNRIATRSNITTPLYEEVNSLKEGVNLPIFKNFIETEGKFAKGTNKKTFKYLENILENKSFALPEKVFVGGKEWESISLPENIRSQIRLGNQPIPAEIVEAIKDINGNIGVAKKAGNKAKVQILEMGKASLLQDISVIPQEQIARNTYAQLSKPVASIEKQPLLKKIVKKDLYDNDFLLSPEKIPDMILNGSLNDTKALVAEIGREGKTLDIVRGSVVDKLINTSELSSSNAAGKSNLSYNKIDKFLNKNKEKLKYIFNPDQIKVLDEVKDVLKRRNMVATMGRGVGSNTQAQTTLLEELTNPIKKSFTNKVASQIPGGSVVNSIFNVVKEYEKQQITNLLEKALLDPETAKLLLTPVKDIKTQESLISILTRIGIPASISSYNNQLQRGDEE